MALNGMNGVSGGSPLDRFQAIRDSAKKKIDTGEGQANLADLIKRKQAQLGKAPDATGTAKGTAPTAGSAFKALAERILPGFGASLAGASAANGSIAAGLSAQGGSGNAAGLNGPSGYGRSGGLQKQDSRPTLGRHVDFMA